MVFGYLMAIIGAMSGTLIDACTGVEGASVVRTSGVQAQGVGRSDVIWDTPSEDAAGSMPIGNGEVVANVWTERKSGDVLLLLARSDSFSEICRMLKLARVRISFGKHPFETAPDFRQHLRLHDGAIEISGAGNHILVFVDAASDVLRVCGTLSEPQSVKVEVEDWRDHDRALPNDEAASAWTAKGAPFPLIESADRFLPAKDSVSWYHRNETSIVPQVLENQSLVGLPGCFDPLLHRTFGGKISGAGLIATGNREASTAVPTANVDIAIATHCNQAPSVKQWVDELNAMPLPAFDVALRRTKAWWSRFWDRSSVVVSGTADAEVINRGYALQRYVQACQGLGRFPIKFNGGAYTVEPKAMGRDFDPDWRNWGDCHWFQNIRHMYHPMLAQGDFDMMEPFFKLYEAALPLAESRTRKYHGAEGAYFPETMTIFGTYSPSDYGWDRAGKSPAEVDSPWWRYAWNQGLELVALMLDRWDYTSDRKFLTRRTLRMADSVLRYFDTRFAKDSRGHIVLDPTQVVETYWSGVVNDMPSTAGLIAVTRRLCALPPSLVSPGRRAFYRHMLEAAPELPMQGQGDLRELAPAQKYSPQRTNVENGELYGVWPFRLVSVSQPQLLSEAKRAYADRHDHLDVGWGYDGNVAALLGMTEESARILLRKVNNSNPAYRWPATWGPNFDWLPDQNHGGNLLNTTNLMLLQTDPLNPLGPIRILPAWPKAWDVEFKLHATGNTVVHCVARGGRIETLEVSPRSRLKDVVLPEGWGPPRLE